MKEKMNTENINSIIEPVIDNPAMSVKKNKPAKKTVKPIFEVDPFFPTTDPVITSLYKAQKKKNKKKKKDVSDWSNSDFIKYLDKNLKNLGTCIEDYSLKGRENFSRMYDLLAMHFKKEMNNHILKEYLDWWTFNIAPLLRTETTSTHALLKDKYIGSFLTYYSTNQIVDGQCAIKPQSEKIENTDYSQIYLTGGLSALLMSGGIVIANRVLKSNKVAGRFGKITEEISKMPKSAVIALIHKTTGNAPYLDEDKCDFISLSRGALNFHGIKEFQSMNYENYFRGKL